MSIPKPRGGERPGALQPESWLAAAEDALAEGGIGTVKVELLAARLGVTKGSFYWHFKDREALLDALAGKWRDGRVEAIEAQAGDAALRPRERLSRLLDLYLDHANPRGIAIELAIRDWARRDRRAQRASAAVDAARLATVSGLFEEMGLEAEDAAARALAFYAFIFGQSLITADPSPVKARARRERCAELLLG